MLAPDLSNMSFTLRTIAALFSVFIYTCTSASENSKVTDLLTEQQLEYISKKGVIKVCIDPKWMPYEAISEDHPLLDSKQEVFASPCLTRYSRPQIEFISFHKITF